MNLNTIAYGARLKSNGRAGRVSAAHTKDVLDIPLGTVTVAPAALKSSAREIKRSAGRCSHFKRPVGPMAWSPCPDYCPSCILVRGMRKCIRRVRKPGRQHKLRRATALGLLCAPVRYWGIIHRARPTHSGPVILKQRDVVWASLRVVDVSGRGVRFRRCPRGPGTNVPDLISESQDTSDKKQAALRTQKATSPPRKIWKGQF